MKIIFEVFLERYFEKCQGSRRALVKKFLYKEVDESGWRCYIIKWRKWYYVGGFTKKRLQFPFFGNLVRRVIKFLAHFWKKNLFKHFYSHTLFTFPFNISISISSNIPRHISLFISTIAFSSIPYSFWLFSFVCFNIAYREFEYVIEKYYLGRNLL